MSQHDLDIANQTSANARADINSALAALVSLSSGATAPSTTFANMFWYDTTAKILKMRSEANDAWISLLYIDQTNNLIHFLEDTEVTDSSGVKKGKLSVQAEAAWVAGTGTEETLVSPAKVAAAAAVVSPVKAWVNFNGTGVVAIRGSNNVASITDNGTGDYTINFTTAMADANYAITATAGYSGVSAGSNRYSVSISEQTTTYVRIQVQNHGNAFPGDPEFCSVMVVR